MCKWGNTVSLVLRIPACISHTGREYNKLCDIDECIAPIVKALNEGGITTIASCCGHGKGLGNIALADGRELLISPNRAYSRKIGG